MSSSDDEVRLDKGGPESTAWCPYKKRGIWTLAETVMGGDGHAHRGHVKREAGMGTRLQAKGRGVAGSCQRLEKPQGLLPDPFRRPVALPTPWFQTSAD